MAYPPQIVYTTTGSTSYIRLWDYKYTPGMSFTAYDGVYNWAAAAVDYTEGPAVVQLVCQGLYPLVKVGRPPFSSMGMTVTIVNPPNAPIPVPVSVFYATDV